MARLSLPLSAWPAGDHAMWHAAFRQAPFLARRGRATGWSPATAKEVQKNYARWLGFLDSRDRLGPESFPSTRCTADNLEAYIDTMIARELSPVTQHTRVRDIREAIRVMEPDADLALLSELAASLNANAHPKRNKASRLLHPREMNEVVLKRLAEIPSLLCKEEHIRATWYRDAVAMLFLIWRPIRLKNLSSLCLGKQLTKEHGCWRCSFSVEEMKDRRPLEFSLPQVVGDHLDVYLERYRPILCGGLTSDIVWMSKRRRPMAQQSMYLCITNLAHLLFDKHISPHLIRDIAATALAEDDPEHVLAIARILGHVTLTTSNRHYNHAQMTRALQRLHDTLEILRNEVA